MTLSEHCPIPLSAQHFVVAVCVCVCVVIFRERDIDFKLKANTETSYTFVKYFKLSTPPPLLLLFLLKVCHHFNCYAQQARVPSQREWQEVIVCRWLHDHQVFSKSECLRFHVHKQSPSRDSHCSKECTHKLSSEYKKQGCDTRVTAEPARGPYSDMLSRCLSFFIASTHTLHIVV